MKRFLFSLLLCLSAFGQPSIPPLPNRIYDVRNYGAVGDGVTDDTTAIQSAIATASGYGGGVVYFPYGTYLISRTIQVTNQLMTLQGANMSTTRSVDTNGLSLQAITNGVTIVQLTDNIPIISVAGHNDKIEGLNLQMNNLQSSANTGAACVLLSDQTVACRLQNLTMGKATYGIRGVGFVYACVLDNIVIESATRSWLKWDSGENNTATSLYFQNAVNNRFFYADATNISKSGTVLVVTNVSGVFPSGIHVGSSVYASGYSPSAYTFRGFVTNLTETTITVNLNTDPGVSPTNTVSGRPGAWTFLSSPMVGPGIDNGAEWDIQGLTTEITQITANNPLVKSSSEMHIGKWHVEEVTWTTGSSSQSLFLDNGRATDISEATIVTVGLAPGQTITAFSKGNEGVLHVGAVRFGGNYTTEATFNVGSTNSSGGRILIAGIATGGSTTANSNGNYDSLGAAETVLTSQAAAITYAPLASPTFTGTVTSTNLSATYAPIASPTFTGTVTLPSATTLAAPTISGGVTIAGTVTSTNLSATYAPIASPSFTGTVTLPARGITFADGTTQTTIRNAMVYTIVATPSVPPIGISYYTGDNGTNSIYSIASSERIFFPQTTYGIEPTYIGYWNTAASSNPWSYTNSVENPLPNALEIACTVFDSSGRGVPITFNGNRIARLNPYAWLKSDPHGEVIQAGDWVRVNGWVNRLVSTTNTYNNGEAGLLPSTQTYLPLRNPNAADSYSWYTSVNSYAAGLNTTETKIDQFNGFSGSYAANGTGFQFLPSFYAGWVKQSDLRSIVAVGDSITASLHDGFTIAGLDSGCGYIVRATKYSNPVLNLGIGGEQARQWTTNTANKLPEWRISALKNYRFAYATIALGGNDFASGLRTYSAFTNDYAQVVAQVYAATQAKIIAITPYPFQISVNGKYYGAGDLSPSFATWTNLAAFNDLLRTNPTALGPISKVFDLAALWETTTNSGVAKYFTNALATGTVTTQNAANFGNVLYRTLIDTNQNWTVNQWVDEPVQITNSSPAWPANAYVMSNSPTTLYLGWPAGVSVSLVPANALSVGATYSIGNGAFTDDGAHPVNRFHKLAATNLLNQAVFN